MKAFSSRSSIGRLTRCDSGPHRLRQGLPLFDDLPVDGGTFRVIIHTGAVWSDQSKVGVRIPEIPAEKGQQTRVILEAVPPRDLNYQRGIRRNRGVLNDRGPRRHLTCASFGPGEGGIGAGIAATQSDPSEHCGESSLVHRLVLRSEGIYPGWNHGRGGRIEVRPDILLPRKDTAVGGTDQIPEKILGTEGDLIRIVDADVTAPDHLRSGFPDRGNQARGLGVMKQHDIFRGNPGGQTGSTVCRGKSR